MKGRPKSAKGCLATSIRPREAKEESFVDRNLRDGKTAIVYVFEMVDSGEEVFAEAAEVKRVTLEFLVLAVATSTSDASRQQTSSKRHIKRHHFITVCLCTYTHTFYTRSLLEVLRDSGSLTDPETKFFQKRGILAHTK